MEKEEKEETKKIDDPMGKARELIREAIINKNGESDDRISEEKGGSTSTAQNPEDVLAYSRTVHHTDSSLE